MESYRDEIFDELNKQYIFIREENKKKQAQKTAEIYVRLPRIKEIDEEIDSIGLSTASAVLNGDVPPKNAVYQMKTKTDSLIAEKNELLKRAGYTPDAMDEIYSCKECMDKGYVSGRRCRCYNRRYNLLLQKYSNICMSDKSSFDTFNINLYSDKADSKYGISPRENMNSVYDIALSFCEGRENSPQNLLFYGATGLGKTFLSDCIAKKHIEEGKTVFYMSAPKLFSSFEEYKFGRDTTAKNKRVIDSVLEAELLIIDDLGTEFRNAYSDSILFDIVNSRIIEKKRMIISTNLSIKDLKHIYSERICSRILGNFTVMLFFGDDIRMKH